MRAQRSSRIPHLTGAPGRSPDRRVGGIPAMPGKPRLRSYGVPVDRPRTAPLPRWVTLETAQPETTTSYARPPHLSARYLARLQPRFRRGDIVRYGTLLYRWLTFTSRAATRMLSFAWFSSPRLTYQRATSTSRATAQATTQSKGISTRSANSWAGAPRHRQCRPGHRGRRSAR